MEYKEFNEKYKDYLKTSHYGLDIDIPEFTEWLDDRFKYFITNPDFKYSQIKAIFGMGRFYCEGLDQDSIYEVEQKITELFKIN